ncbi:MAG TPA: type II secretion system F family protein [bacterium]|nr:type II secretion system F family protein [bacterium]HPP12342.1 type II secretion system F family protein [bacterium]
MAIFTYSALDQRGRKVSGTMEAEDTQRVRRLLKEKGIYPLQITPAGTTTFSLLPVRVSTEELVVAMRELATLINSKIPLDECLSGLISQMRPGKLREVFTDIQRRIREGNSFSLALKEYPQYFSAVIVSMAKAGEESGTLDLILQRVADFLEKRLSFRNRLLSILTYPALMSVVAVLVLFFILTFVAPTLTRVFQEISLTLPLPTRILIRVSYFFKAYWAAVLVALGFLWFGLRRSLKSSSGVIFVDNLKLRLPYLRDLFIKSEIASFSRTMATLLAGGVDILEAFTITEKVVSSPRLQTEVRAIREFLSRGGSLSNGFHNARLFPYLVTQLVNAGEKSGDLPEMFLKIATIYEEEVAQKSTRLVTLIEPVMILFMGAVVSFIVLAVLLPIFQISQSIK